MINDNMPDWIIQKLILNMTENINIIESEILILELLLRELS